MLCYAVITATTCVHTINVVRPQQRAFLHLLKSDTDAVCQKLYFSPLGLTRLLRKHSILVCKKYTTVPSYRTCSGCRCTFPLPDRLSDWLQFLLRTIWRVSLSVSACLSFHKLKMKTILVKKILIFYRSSHREWKGATLTIQLAWCKACRRGARASPPREEGRSSRWKCLMTMHSTRSMTWWGDQKAKTRAELRMESTLQALHKSENSHATRSLFLYCRCFFRHSVTSVDRVPCPMGSRDRGVGSITYPDPRMHSWFSHTAVAHKDCHLTQVSHGLKERARVERSWTMWASFRLSKVSDVRLVVQAFVMWPDWLTFLHKLSCFCWQCVRVWDRSRASQHRKWQ